MKKIIMTAAGAFLAMSTAASALTVTFLSDPIPGYNFTLGTVITGEEIPGTLPSVVEQNLDNGTASIDFTWVGTDPNYLAYSAFTTDASFQLTFQDYAPESDEAGAVDARSGFQIYRGTFGDTLTSLLPNTPESATPCGQDVITHFGSSDCVLVTGAGNDGTDFVVPPITYSISGAGSYVLMFSEGNFPAAGGAEFIISAVPLPAGGLLLLTGFGALALRRRRKAA